MTCFQHMKADHIEEWQSPSHYRQISVTPGTWPHDLSLVFEGLFSWSHIHICIHIRWIFPFVNCIDSQIPQITYPLQNTFGVFSWPEMEKQVWHRLEPCRMFASPAQSTRISDAWGFLFGRVFYEAYVFVFSFKSVTLHLKFSQFNQRVLKRQA